MTSRVVVTGGSGVVGAAVVRHLVASGVTPLCASRSEESDLTLRSMGAEPIRADILDRDRMTELVVGAPVVYHVAGVNQMCADDPAPMYRANVDGSRNVVAACRTGGVGRLVYTSSAAAIGEPAGTVGTERTVHRGWYLSEYERSKHLAERAVFADAGSLEVVSVNPSSVQGPGRAGGTGKLILDLLNGRLPVLVDTQVSIVDIDDCARAHLLAAEHGEPGHRYLINSFTLGMREAVALIEQVVGRRLGVRFLPKPVVEAAGRAAGLVGRLARVDLPFCAEMVRTLTHGHAYDGSTAERELGLGYTRPVDLLTRLIGWFRSEGMLVE